MSLPVPNTTQIPHVIIREWMPLLKDTELRILLVVADQTLGWIEDEETGRRKERDWISHYQLRTRIKKRGKKVGGARAVTAAIASLVDVLGIVQAMDESGRMLNAPNLRMQHGGKIYYRLHLRRPDSTLFDTPAKSAGVGIKPLEMVDPPQKVRAQKGKATKETLFTKGMLVEVAPAPPDPRKKDHTAFMGFWHDTVRAARGFTPVIAASEGANLKRLLACGISESLLEQMALYYLADPNFKTFNPSINTFASAGIINGLINKTKNDPEFHKRLNQYIDRFMPRRSAIPTQLPRAYGLLEIQAGLQQLASRFSVQTP